MPLCQTSMSPCSSSQPQFALHHHIPVVVVLPAFLHIYLAARRDIFPDIRWRLWHSHLFVQPILAANGFVVIPIMSEDVMGIADGRHYVEEQRRIEKEVVEGTLALLPKEQADQMRPLLESQTTYTPERAREEARDPILQAQMVGKSFPLSFIAQLDLGTLSAQAGFDPDLPKNGRLMLFYDLLETPPGWEPSSRVGFRLIWNDTPATDLIRASVPATLSEIQYREKLVLEPALIVPHSVVTPISPSVKAWDANLLDRASSQQFGEGPYWSYMAWLSRFGSSDEPGRANHQLGGWPQPQQNGMQARAQLASNGISAGTSDAYDSSEAKEILKGAADWKLVLQVGADEAVGLRGGAYYMS